MCVCARHTVRLRLRGGGSESESDSDQAVAQSTVTWLRVSDLPPPGQCRQRPEFGNHWPWHWLKLDTLAANLKKPLQVKLTQATHWQPGSHGHGAREPTVARWGGQAQAGN